MVFGPAGDCCQDAEHIKMSLDELEALRLADLEGLYQEEASRRMGVSRATFGRILEAARRKVARVLVEGRPLEVVGGVVSCETPEECPRCQEVVECGECGDGGCGSAIPAISSSSDAR